MKTGEGWKFLDPTGCTYYEGTATQYPLPRPGETWGPWLEHPSPAVPDGQDCGPGRFHVMRRLDARYAPRNWWPWRAEYSGVIGSSEEKLGVKAVRLRRVSPEEFHDLIRTGECQGANLQGANLQGADLRDANLRYTNLWYADLRDANLQGADLRDADLRYASLWDASLWDANLLGASLRYADLQGAITNRHK